MTIKKELMNKKGIKSSINRSPSSEQDPIKSESNFKKALVFGVRWSSISSIDSNTIFEESRKETIPCKASKSEETNWYEITLEINTTSGNCA